MPKKPPPPSYRPVAGFASVTEAVRHFRAEGKSPKEIAVLVESTTEAVRGLMQKERQHRRTTATDGLTWPQREKIKRTYLAYLDLMANALGSDRDTLHNLCRGVHVNKEPALPPERKAVEAKAGAPDLDGDHFTDASNMVEEPSEEIDPKPEEPPVLVVAQQRAVKLETIAGQCYLKNKTTGAYLHFSGQLLTMEKSQRWRGTAQQAKAMRQQSAVAKALTLVSAVPMAPTGARL